MPSTFLIAFEPPILPAETVPVPESLEGLDWTEILAVHTQYYDVLYRIDGKLFCYYPADVVTVLSDLHFEWQCARKRQSHVVTLSGYTVLDIDFQGETARFYDPLERSLGSERQSIGGEFSAESIEFGFRSASAAVWNLM
ncbi:unnamed protein product, partial [Phaeothamnion confervicola]